MNYNDQRIPKSFAVSELDPDSKDVTELPPGEADVFWKLFKVGIMR